MREAYTRADARAAHRRQVRARRARDRARGDASPRRRRRHRAVARRSARRLSRATGRCERRGALGVRRRQAAQREHAFVADLRRTIDPDTVWSRFTGGKDGTVRWYRRVYDRLREVGFTRRDHGRARARRRRAREWTDDARRDASELAELDVAPRIVRRDVVLEDL